MDEDQCRHLLPHPKEVESEKRGTYQASSVMMAKNSSMLISPSWSRSNSSIIAWLFRTRKGKQRKGFSTAPRTHQKRPSRRKRTRGEKEQEKGERRGRRVRDVQLVLIETFAQLFGDPSEVAHADLARPVVVEELERAANLLARVSSEQMLGHCCAVG